MTTEPGAVTELLRLASAGDEAAFDRAFSLLYDELRTIARAQMRHEAVGHTLETRALVHEAWARLRATDTPPTVHDRTHFLGVAATAMRRVLIEHARRRHAQRRGGGTPPIDFDASAMAAVVREQSDALLALDEALDELAKARPRAARVVDCRFFGGLTEAETAAALGIGLRTAKRDWAEARGWLLLRLQDDGVR